MRDLHCNSRSLTVTRASCIVRTWPYDAYLAKEWQYLQGDTSKERGMHRANMTTRCMPRQRMTRHPRTLPRTRACLLNHSESTPSIPQACFRPSANYSPRVHVRYTRRLTGLKGSQCNSGDHQPSTLRCRFLTVAHSSSCIVRTWPTRCIPGRGTTISSWTDD